jgi:large subunit ribosomal protein L32
MPVPKKKTSKSKRDMRRSHDFIEPVNAIVCTNCGAFTLPHHACSSCGYYRGRLVLKLDKKTVVEEE